MREVSKMTGNSKTTIFDIVHEADSPDKQIIRCHNLRSNLCENGMTLRGYADFIRAENIFIKDDVQRANVLTMTREVSIFCFKACVDPKVLVFFFDNFRQFVVSLAREFPGNLESSLESELKYLETKVHDLDMTLARCGQLRNVIDLLEKMVSRSSGSTVKH